MDQLSTVAKASDIQMDYMTLLVAQLQNQNPLEPLDNKEMASQLAQFSQLQQLETMNVSFSKVLATIQQSYASSLIGKEVSFATEDEDGLSDILTSTVEQVFSDADGEIGLFAGDYIIGLGDVLSVK